jgi:hypothetical protein
MLFCDLRLDELILGQHVGVVRVAMSVEMGQRLEGLVCSIVVREPSEYIVSFSFVLVEVGILAHLGDSGNWRMRAARNIAGTIWQANGMRHSLLFPVPAHVI